MPAAVTVMTLPPAAFPPVCETVRMVNTDGDVLCPCLAPGRRSG